MPATPQVVARDWFEQVWNQGSEEAIDRYLATDALMHGLSGPDGQPLRGPALPRHGVAVALGGAN